MRNLGLLLLIPICLSAQQRIFTTSGRVLDVVTKRGIEGVLVKRSTSRPSPGPLETRTDAEGNWSFNAASSGYDIRYEKPGYVDWRQNMLGVSGARGIYRRAGLEYTTSEVICWMMPEATLKGTIVDEDGNPLPQSEITATQAHNSSAQPVWAKSNAKGEFELKLLAVSYKVHIQDPRGRFSRDFLPGRKLFFGAYFPENGELRLKPGERREATIRLSPRTTYKVNGNVYNLIRTYRNPKIHVSVVEKIAGRFGERRGVAGELVSRNDGQFQVAGVPAGAYLLTATVFEDHGNCDTCGLGDLVSVSVPITVDARDLSGIELTLYPGAAIAGQIVRMGDSAQKPFSNVAIRRISDGVADSSSNIPTDGKFRFRPRGPGEFNIIFSDRDGYYLHHLQVNGETLTKPSFTIPNEGAPIPVELHIRYPDSEIFAKFASGKGPSSYTALLINEGDESRGLSSRVLQPIDNPDRGSLVPPGAYRLVVLSPCLAPWELDQDLLKKYSPQGKAIEIAEGQKLQVEIDPIYVPPPGP